MKNAELDPMPTDRVREYIDADEVLIVEVVSKSGVRYWLSDRRLLLENEAGVSTLFRYEEVSQVHWMFKDYFDQVIKAADFEEEITKMKSAHFDRLEVELKDATQPVVLEGLEQAYSPILQFLKLVSRVEKPAQNG